MSVTSADLVIYGSKYMPEVDGTTAGSGIDTTVKIVFDNPSLANAPAGTVGIRSTQAVDTAMIGVYGRNSYGQLLYENLTLSGATSVSGTATYERILKVVASGAHNGTVTLYDVYNSGICSLESGVLSCRRPFYNVSADAAGGATRTYYEKVFLKNNNAANALLNATVHEYADPSNVITFSLENAQNGANLVANRQTSPGGSFASTPVAIAGTDLLPGSGVGIWMCMTLTAGLAPAKTTYTVLASGTTI